MCAQGPLLCGSFDVCRSPLMFGYCKNPPPRKGFLFWVILKTKTRRKRTQQRKKPWGFLQSAKVSFDVCKTLLINMGLFWRMFGTAGSGPRPAWFTCHDTLAYLHSQPCLFQVSFVSLLVSFVSVLGLFCQFIGLFCQYVGFLCQSVGFFCQFAGLFCQFVGLFVSV